MNERLQDILIVAALIISTLVLMLAVLGRKI